MKIPENLYPIPQILNAIRRKSAVIAISRLLLFFLMIALLIIGLTENRLYLFPLPVLILVFAVLINRFNYFKDLKAFVLELEQMEIEQELRKKRTLKSFDPGTVFLEKAHPFCNDLDLFGTHSLFQLLNRTVSKSGELLLASEMKSQINPKHAADKYHAIEELRKQETLLLHFQAAGRAFYKEEKDKTEFYHWLKTKEKWNALFLAFMWIGPIGGMLFLWGTLFADWPLGWLWIWIILGGILLSINLKSLNKASKIWPGSGDIKTFRVWAELLSQQKFTDPYLQHMHRQFADGQFSRALSSLEQISFLVQNRLNFIYIILNFLFWLDFFLLWRLHGWKLNFASDLSEVEKIFDQWQLLIALAAFSNEEQLDGEIHWVDDDSVECSDIKHPLLSKEKAIGNDFKLAQGEKITLLTGANMSGKTTFMRTLGINMVMVNLGLRPFAKSLRMGNYLLYTSMRNTDDLGESVSSFYAELYRIRQVLEGAEKQEKIFFLMDEILKGTNTKDRILGSEALIRQLSETASKGIISTHDIELSDLERTMPFLVNYSFHSEISDNHIHFDYRIKAGPCPSFNAHKLMELMGVRFK